MGNKEELLECALNLFAAKGYEAVGVQEIVEMAGVTKPTLYHYFTSKRGLLDALLKENFENFIDTFRSAAFYQRDLVLTLENITRTYFEAARANPQFFRLQLILQYAPLDSEPGLAISTFRVDQQNMLQNLFIQAVQEHGNMRGRHTLISAAFLGMIHTYIGEFLNGRTTLEEPLAYQVVHQFMHGILS